MNQTVGVHFMNSGMTQDERWQSVEHNMLNWCKANRKVLNAGKMKVERAEMFNKLLKLAEKYKHVNQYQ